MSSAAQPTNPVNAAVALAVVLGSRTAEMLAMHSSITRGPRAYRLANVGCRESDFCDMQHALIVW